MTPAYFLIKRIKLECYTIIELQITKLPSKLTRHKSNTVQYAEYLMLGISGTIGNNVRAGPVRPALSAGRLAYKVVTLFRPAVDFIHTELAAFNSF